MQNEITLGPKNAPGYWLDHPEHRRFLAHDAKRQFKFFRASRQDGPGFAGLDHAGKPLPDMAQELHTTTRLVHSYALGMLWGYEGAGDMVDQGMTYLTTHHRDPSYGGYVWAMQGDTITDDRKLAYGHMFVLLAAASAKMAGHPDADALLADISEVLDQRFWDADAGLFSDESNRDWTPFSTYRGMNANMHGVEAHLAAYEATGEAIYLQRASQILDFFTGRIAPQNNWRLPEHYTENWDIDWDYAGDPMFRPAGSTPGHSFELGRLLLQCWDLKGRPESDAPTTARHLIEHALHAAWLPNGGFAYTLKQEGTVDNPSRYWWPVTEAIGAVAALLKLEPRATDEEWYRRLWEFGFAHFIDHEHGGWFPEIDPSGKVTTTIFHGKPDIYHSLQACLFPMVNGLSRQSERLKDLHLPA